MLVTLTSDLTFSNCRHNCVELTCAEHRRRAGTLSTRHWTTSPDATRKRKVETGGLRRQDQRGLWRQPWWWLARFYKHFDNCVLRVVHNWRYTYNVSLFLSSFSLPCNTILVIRHVHCCLIYFLWPWLHQWTNLKENSLLWTRKMSQLIYSYFENVA